MTFTTTQNTPPKLSWWMRFSSQSHQLFFTSAVVFAIILMGFTFVSLLGIGELNFSIVHSFGLIYGVFTNAFLGFLITVIPKYSTSKAIEKKVYLTIWCLYQIAIFLVLIGFVMIGKLLLATVLFYIVYIFFTTIKYGYSGDKRESYLLTFLLFCGAVFVLMEIFLRQNLTTMIFYGYLVNIVFLVALKMVPSFYSIYTQKPKWQKPKYTLEISLLILLCMGIATQFEMVFAGKMIVLIALGFFGYVIFHLDIYTKTPAIISILVLSFFWFYMGILAYFFETMMQTNTMKLSLHIFALGFVLNLLIGFGSRVIMGHAVPAQKIVADRFTVGLFVLMQLVIVSRILASILYIGEFNFFMGFFHLSATLWIVLFLSWAMRYGKTLLRITT